MDLKLLSRVSGLDYRKLRYVCDSDLMRSLKAHKCGRGKSRQFDEIGAFTLLAAGMLSEHGFDRTQVREYLPSQAAMRKLYDGNQSRKKHLHLGNAAQISTTMNLQYLRQMVKTAKKENSST
jgi:hypothetical protein